VLKDYPQWIALKQLYKGSASITEKGLEISAMTVIDVNHKLDYSLSVQQMPAKIPSFLWLVTNAVDLIIIFLNDFLTSLEPTLIKSHPNYSSLYDYGVIVA
jgi:hypothetical protein